MIYLVSCSKTKRLGRYPAKDLYSSPLFQKTRLWVEGRGEWYILSAKYGLLDPRQEIETYSQTLYQMSSIERSTWGRGVAESLFRQTDRSLTVFAGEIYRSSFVPFLRDLFSVTVPLRGMQIGEQLHWFNKEMK